MKLNWRGISLFLIGAAIFFLGAYFCFTSEYVAKIDTTVEVTRKFKPEPRKHKQRTYYVYWLQLKHPDGVERTKSVHYITYTNVQVGKYYIMEFNHAERTESGSGPYLLVVLLGVVSVAISLILILCLIWDKHYKLPMSNKEKQ
jgi:hypothetical protein